MKIEAVLDHQTILENRQSSIHFRVRLRSEDPPASGARCGAYVVLIDRSLPMQGKSFELGQRIIAEFIRHLPTGARLGIVAFEETAEWILPVCDAVDRESVAAVAAQIRTGESGCDLSAGWMLAREELQSGDRIFLLSGGENPKGILEMNALANLAAQAAFEPIRTSTFGLGNGRNSNLMEMLAGAGGGIFHGGSNEENIRNSILAELGALRPTIAQNVRVRLKALDYCEEIRSLGAHRVSRSEEGLELRVGDFLAGEDRTFCFNLEVQPFPCIDGKPIASLEGEPLLELEVCYDKVMSEGVSSECFTQTICVQSDQAEGRKSARASFLPSTP